MVTKAVLTSVLAGPLGSVAAAGYAVFRPVVASVSSAAAGPIIKLGDPETPTAAQADLTRQEFTTLAVGLTAALAAGTGVYLFMRKK